jgi:hypothetical protein
LAGLPPNAEMPAPAKLIFEVDPKIHTRSGLPASAQARSTSATGASFSSMWCTA